MSFDYLNNIPSEQALQEYLAYIGSKGFSAEAEEIPVTEACGRIVSEAVYARISSPHYPACAMDGIALKAALTFGATETTPVTLHSADFVPVDTGDPLPGQADCVVMIEDVIQKGDGTVCLYAPASPWQHVRQIGEDICAGEMILASRSVISASAVGALLAGGILSVKVFKKPVVGILPTGDEIVPPTDNPRPGDILEFNSSIFSATLKEWGAETKVYPILPDKKEKIKSVLKEACETCDIVLLNAGSSAGRDDYSCSVLEECGHVLFHGIAIKPGKPAILGSCLDKPVIGIPGYPVSGIIVLDLFVRPLVDLWYGNKGKQHEICSAILSRQVTSSLKYREFIRVRLGCVSGRMIAAPLGRGSGMVTSIMKADGILEIPQNCEGYEAGTTVEVRLFATKDKLKNTLVATGSHDPLLDEISDLLHTADSSMYMSSTHVGSMGGIMAIRRKEAHIAGIHLLSETDGSYNTAFIHKYFPQGGVLLLECVERIQGLMVQKGNPKHIGGIADLARTDIRYVNRQKGSGTRILLDYLLKKEQIPADEIYGYDREEYTHNSVAIQISSGSADAGMGICSAANLYGLDFIPVCTEQYDLLVSEGSLDLPVVQMLIRILKSKEFRSRLERLGGYILQSPGNFREI